MIDCVIVIPIYKYNLEEYEKHSLYSIFNILQKDYCITAICGETFDMQKFYNDNNIKNFTFDRVITFDNKYFNSINSYNDLCLTNDLYKAFLNEFEYMLIAQTDCLILSNQLKKFIDKKYYYIGSPIVWPNTVEALIHYPTGRYYNGGFSLRNLEFFNTVTNNKFLINSYINRGIKDEDFIYSSIIQTKYPNNPTFIDSMSFCMDECIGYSFSVTDGMMPFALHHFYNDTNKDNIYHIKGFGWYDLDKKVEL